MRILIDMQGAQAGNRDRGIGRFTLSLTRQLLEVGNHHEFILLVNGAFQDSIDKIVEVLRAPNFDLRVWFPPVPVHHSEDVVCRRLAAERIREAVILEAAPDVVLVSSLFEGFGENAATTVQCRRTRIPTAVTLYDLIPLIRKDVYFRNSDYRTWYMEKLSQLKSADALLAISQSSANEAIEYLGFEPNRVHNVSCAVDEQFLPRAVGRENSQAIRSKFGLREKFVMYTGGIDFRKNIDGLIKAFSLLPANKRRNHQLAIVCKADETERERLQRLATEVGLAPDEVVFTGFVTDSELIDLYNMTELFVFPSLHEGFGLPALEAMSCGAPVIAGNNSSLPEIVVRSDALFDAEDPASIAKKLQEAIEDTRFRESLRKHGLERSKHYSWKNVAVSSLAALERLAETRTFESYRKRGQKLAFVSPLPPAKTGIADYSSELLPELASYYDIDLFVPKAEPTSLLSSNSLAVRSIVELDRLAHSYDRIVYHFGNSAFHSEMFELLQRKPGVVVLHDFFLSGILFHKETHEGKAKCWSDALYNSHGYKALVELERSKDPIDLVWSHPANWDVIASSIGLIVHSNFAKDLVAKWYRADLAEKAYVIPHHRAFARIANRTTARRKLQISDNDFIACSFGFMGRNKLSDQVIEAWKKTFVAQKNSRLVFVGERPDGEYGKTIDDLVSQSDGSIAITNYVSSETYQLWLNAADVAIQLRKDTRGESSGAVLDAMNHGLPVIANAHGALAELPRDCVTLLSDPLDLQELVTAIDQYGASADLRASHGTRAREFVREELSPRKVAALHFDAIERSYSSKGALLNALCKDVANIADERADETIYPDIAGSIARSFPRNSAKRQLLVDVSELVQRDAGSGIQRVVKNVLAQLVNMQTSEFRIEPVYCGLGGQYRYARKFTLNFLHCSPSLLEDELVEVSAGDIFLALDLQPLVVAANRSYYRHLSQIGVRVLFVVYDILCIQRPEFFLPGAQELMRKWLEVVLESDGAICISQSVANDLRSEMQNVSSLKAKDFQIEWFHLGADFVSVSPAKFEDLRALLGDRATAPTILLVGTIEPRKGCDDALSAFEMLWNRGVDANLVFVGKKGWMVDELVESIRNHPMLGVRLFWFSEADDENLAALYQNCTGVFVCSKAEGFGLPLIEASHYGRPILARDIPVFREVAGQNASYFPSGSISEISDYLESWINAAKSGSVISSRGLKYLSWSESSKWLWNCITK